MNFASARLTKNSLRVFTPGNKSLANVLSLIISRVTTSLCLMPHSMTLLNKLLSMSLGKIVSVESVKVKKIGNLIYFITRVLRSTLVMIPMTPTS